MGVKVLKLFSRSCTLPDPGAISSSNALGTSSRMRFAVSDFRRLIGSRRLDGRWERMTASKIWKLRPQNLWGLPALGKKVMWRITVNSTIIIKEMFVKSHRTKSLPSMGMSHTWWHRYLLLWPQVMSRSGNKVYSLSPLWLYRTLITHRGNCSRKEAQFCFMLW